MQKIRVTESQLLMLQNLKEDKPKTRVMRINEDQYKRLFKKGFNTNKKVERSINKNDLNEGPKEKVSLQKFAQELIVFIKDMISRPQTAPFSKFWSELGIGKDELIKMLEDEGLLTLSLGEGEGEEMFVAEKYGFRGKVRECYKKMIKELGDAGYPAGSQFNPNAPWNEPKTSKLVTPKSQPLKMIYFNNEIAIFGDEKNKYAIYYADIDKKEFEAYAEREELGNYRADDDYYTEYSDNWEINDDVVDDYVNDNAYYLEKGKGLNDWEKGYEGLVIIDDELAQHLIEYYGDEKLAKALNGIKETTGAASSGSYVAGASMGPIKKDTGDSPEKAMKNIINEDDIDKSYTHFLIYKPTGKICDGWDYKGVDPLDIKEYTKYDTKDNFPDFKLSQFKLVNGKFLTSQGINPYDSSNWERPTTNLGETMIQDGYDNYDPSKHLAELISAVIEDVDPNLGYKEFAKAVAMVLDDGYGEHTFRVFLDALVDALPMNLGIGESTTTSSVGGSDQWFGYDAPAGNGSDFWTAGNKQNKKMKEGDMPMIKREIKENEQFFPTDDKFRTGFDLPENEQLFQEYARISNLGARSKEEYNSNIKPRLESKVLQAKIHKAQQLGEDVSLFNEELNKRQQYLAYLDQYKKARLSLSNNDPAFKKLKQNLLMAAKSIGIDLQLESIKHLKAVLKLTEKQLNKIIESENMSKTAYPNGEMIDFDDCTKLNNNTKAQDGGCSQGAVDNVVKTRKTKGSVVSEESTTDVANEVGLKLFKTKLGNSDIIYIKGNVYEFKNILKKYHAKWNTKNKVWFWFLDKNDPNKTITTFIKPALEEAKRNQKFSQEIDDIISAIESEDFSENNEVDISNEEKQKIKLKLESFKKMLVNIDSDDEFKQAMKGVIDIRSAQGYRFSFGNALMIFIQNRNAGVVNSKTNWLEKYNRVVKPNARPLMVYAPSLAGPYKSTLSKEKRQIVKQNFYKKINKSPKDKLTPQESFALERELRGYTYASSFKLVPVYSQHDTEQIEGTEDYIAKSEKAKKDMVWFEDNLISDEVRPIYKALIGYCEDNSVAIDLVDDLGGARGVSANGAIRILKNEGNDVGLTKTLVHEIMHELLHQTYLKNKKGNQFYLGKDMDTGTIEQQAELSAWMFMYSFGFDVKTTSLNYTVMWGGNKDNMIKVFNVVSNAVNSLISDVNKRIKSGLTEAVGGVGKFITPEDIANVLGLENEYNSIIGGDSVN